MWRYMVATANPFGVGQVLMYLMFVIAVILLAYGSTLYIAKLYSRGTRSKNIHVLEKLFLATDKSLWLVEVNQYVYLVYVDKNGMTKLDRYNKDELSADFFEDDILNNKKNFSDIFSKYLKKESSNNEK